MFGGLFTVFECLVAGQKLVVKTGDGGKGWKSDGEKLQGECVLDRLRKVFE
ncbi:hypothetical protein [Thiomicrorhabdus sp.]|uniref:hypothetical protein n=1 Tax=Thiomicrorhabdus sp. TaxID=2039724 RepID=UPI0029C981CE|nr:hypothetical protein [Thiomicrorhabdus sp.]